MGKGRRTQGFEGLFGSLARAFFMDRRRSPTLGNLNSVEGAPLGDFRPCSTGPWPTPPSASIWRDLSRPTRRRLPPLRLHHPVRPAGWSIRLPLAAGGLGPRAGVSVGGVDRVRRLDLPAPAHLPGKPPSPEWGAAAGYATSFVEHYMVPLIYPDLLFAGGFPRSGFIAIGTNLKGVSSMSSCWR